MPHYLAPKQPMEPDSNDFDGQLAHKPSLTIESFTEKYREDVIALIVAIQREEFHLPITADDQPDLKDISVVYQNNGGAFLLALMGNEVVGTIALIDIGEGRSALKKMFVKAEFRGGERGVAKKLLNQLIEHAQAAGLKEIYLGTTEFFHAAHRFYEREGFTEILESELPSDFPKMTVDTKFYKRIL